MNEFSINLKNQGPKRTPHPKIIDRFRNYHRASAELSFYMYTSCVCLDAYNFHAVFYSYNT